MDAGTLVPYIAIGVGVLIALIFVTRAIFSIPVIVRYLKAIAQLLAITAEKQGASQAQVHKILQDAEGPKE
ncbi:MAG TPA: hypothetical protein VFT06_00235 [Flavisolibacter sp.]|nr:hypothetical protein [Flavisolibacter sp.]